MPPRLAAAALALLCCALSGCPSDARRAEQARIVNLAEHIGRLRRADNRDKAALLAALKRADCVGPDACGLKDLCVRAYEVHQRALDEIDGLRRVAAADAGATPDVRERLKAAERDLTEARVLGEQCAEEQVRAVRKTML